MRYLYRNLSLVFVVFLWSCTSGDDIVDYSNLGPDETESGTRLDLAKIEMFILEIYMSILSTLSMLIFSVLQPLLMMLINTLKVERFSIL